jgi:hypothetical protein
MTPVQLPHIHFGSVLLGASLLGCGATDAAPSPDSSAGDASGGSQTASQSDAQNSAEAALGDTLEKVTEADTDAGPADGGAACSDAGDCRVFPDMCGTCTCIALGASAASPTCPGPAIECFRDPCIGQSAACVGGHCAAEMQ